MIVARSDPGMRLERSGKPLRRFWGQPCKLQFSENVLFFFSDPQTEGCNRRRTVSSRSDDSPHHGPPTCAEVLTQSIVTRSQQLPNQTA
jgi:hypothetical protein